MKKVTIDELAQILLEKKMIPGKPVICSIVYFVSARLLKTGNPYPDTMKLTKTTVMLNSEYATGVRNQLERENKFPNTYKPGINTMPLNLGENNNFIGEFKGELALQYRMFDNSHPRTKYVNEGRIIDEKEIANFIPQRAEKDNQEGRQGTQKAIFWNKLYLKNVRRMKIDGEEYKVIPKS